MTYLHGVTVAMVTPLDAQQHFAPEPMKELTRRLIRQGVDGLYPCGTTGEMSRLTLEERKSVAETVVSAAAGETTVYIHVGADNPEDTLALARHAMEIGADGVGIVTPLFLRANAQELEHYYLSIAHALPQDFPIYLYNIPQCAANDITAEIAKTIFSQTKNVVGIKYSYTDFERTLEYLNVDKTFSVLHGCDKLFSSFLVLGCQGTVSGVAGVFPEPFIKVYQAYQRGDLAGMECWQSVCREICDILQCGRNMAYFKSGLEFRGIHAGHMRSPQQDLSSQERSRLFDSLACFCERQGIPQQL